jgi:flagellar motor switch protein FliG
MKLSDVAARQKSIVNVIRQLAADGHINMGQGKGDEYV